MPYVFNGENFVDIETNEVRQEDEVDYWNGSDWIRATVTEWLNFRKENNLGMYVETRYGKVW